MNTERLVQIIREKCRNHEPFNSNERDEAIELYFDYLHQGRDNVVIDYYAVDINSPHAEEAFIEFSDNIRCAYIRSNTPLFYSTFFPDIFMPTSNPSQRQFNSERLRELSTNLYKIIRSKHGRDRFSKCAFEFIHILKNISLDYKKRIISFLYLKYREILSEIVHKFIYNRMYKYELYEDPRNLQILNLISEYGIWPRHYSNRRLQDYETIIARNAALKKYFPDIVDKNVRKYLE